jgi:hypothetical protein
MLMSSLAWLVQPDHYGSGVMLDLYRAKLDVHVMTCVDKT